MFDRTKPLRVKVCGITCLADATAAVELGAEAIGLNFYQRSMRCVDTDAAREISQHVASKLARVGVFVNHSADEINQLAGLLDLDLIQLHGDEPPELADSLHRRPLIRAVRCAPGGGQQALAEIQQWAQAPLLCYILLDAWAAGRYGGSGTTLDWPTAAHVVSLSSVPVLLAGGLTPQNVVQAIASIRPAGVDVASGVESFPGKKDRGLMAQFIGAAQPALQKANAAEGADGQPGE